MTEIHSERLHIIEGTDWKQAVIALISAGSPYNPWRYGFSEVHRGDPVAIVLNTDPRSILTVLGRVGAPEVLNQLVFGLEGDDAALLDLTTLTLLAGFKSGEDPRWEWVLHGDAAMKLQLALHECGFSGRDVSARFGHTSLTAARILLRSNGQCDGCATRIDLSGQDACDNVHIHTVDPLERPAPKPPITVHHPRRRSYGAADIVVSHKHHLPDDWPAVLCHRCHTQMREHGYTNFLDYRLSLHPPCPACHAHRTQQAVFGMLLGPVDPWHDARGCCVTDDVWTCTECLHTW